MTESKVALMDVEEWRLSSLHHHKPRRESHLREEANEVKNPDWSVSNSRLGLTIHNMNTDLGPREILRFVTGNGTRIITTVRLFGFTNP